MGLFPGVQTAYLKNGSTYYRASITYNRKHISLGSFDDPKSAHEAYLDASLILSGNNIPIEDYNKYNHLSFQKYISLINLRNNGIYFKTPIYLYPGYFTYHLTPEVTLKFDKDDLFFYSTHTIGQKGGYMFICDYGSQYGILSRYGIHKFAVEGRDYIFANGDKLDYRYQNIKVINHYNGVTAKESRGNTIYTTYIHINGNYIVGHYNTENEAAIAYNKAADTLNSHGFEKQYIRNYILGLNPKEYKEIYEKTKISDKLI